MMMFIIIIIIIIIIMFPHIQPRCPGHGDWQQEVKDSLMGVMCSRDLCRGTSTVAEEAYKEPWKRDYSNPQIALTPYFWSTSRSQ